MEGKVVGGGLDGLSDPLQHHVFCRVRVTPHAKGGSPGAHEHKRGRRVRAGEE